MKEITISLDEELANAKADYERIVSDKMSKQEDKDVAEDKLGNLETIKEEYGSFTMVLKKFTMRESTEMETIAAGLQGGVKSIGKTQITTPNILGMKITAIKYGIKSLEPMVFNFKDANSIGDIDNSLFEWIYTKIDHFNLKNWTYRKKEKNS